MLKTKRCILSKLTKFDYEDIRKLYTNEKVRLFLGGTINEKEYKIKFSNFINVDSNDLYLTIRDKINNKFIGFISIDTYHDNLSKEISYQTLPEFWGLGYGFETLSIFINYGFKELNLNRIVAETQSDNIASCKLLIKLGMKLEKEIERFDNKQSIFSIKKDS